MATRNETTSRAAELIRDAGMEELASKDYLARFLAHYRELETPLLDDRLCGLPLHEACPRSCDCWAAEKDDAYREHGHLSLPWVGAAYDQHRILLLANNMRNDGQVGDELGVVAAVQQALERGHRRVREHMNSTFGFGCAVYGDAVVQLEESRNVSATHRTPAELAQDRIYAKIARLQTVKCSPHAPERDDSPNLTMGHNCPNTYLKGELEILKPRTIIAMGHAAHGRLRTFTDFDVPWKGCVHADASWGEEVRVAATCHPSSNWYKRGYEFLASALST